MSNSGIRNNRLNKELTDLDRDPPPGISCYPKEDDLTDLEAYIKGPPDSPYEQGLFQLDIQIPTSYPFEPPQIRFATAVYHPNIDDAGRICADILKKGEKGSWNPAMNLSTTLISLSQLLAHPNPDDPLDADIAKEYQLDYPTFRQKAIEYTKKYATGEVVLDEPTEIQVENTKVSVEKSECEEEKEEEEKELRKPKLSLSLSKKTSCTSSQPSLPSSLDIKPKTNDLKEKRVLDDIENSQKVTDVTIAKVVSNNQNKKENVEVEDIKKKFVEKNDIQSPKETELVSPETAIVNNQDTPAYIKRKLEILDETPDIIELSDDDIEQDDLVHTLQLSKKLKRNKISLSKQKH